MRWKLANGNVVASTKQPLQWKDFDRIEITSDYDDSDGWEACYGGVPDIEFEILFYNPSTYTIRKSYHRTCPKITIGPYWAGNTGSRRGNCRTGSGEMLLSELDYGSVICSYVYPNISGFDRSQYSHCINPFYKNWYSGKNSGHGRIPKFNDTRKPYQLYDYDSYQVEYAVKFFGSSDCGKKYHHTNNIKLLHNYTSYYIDYKIR